MKVRAGFVSNSSSSSFYVARTEKPLPFEDISKYYELSPSLSEEERVWMSLCIWVSLRSVEKEEAYRKSEGEEDYRYDDSFRLDDYLSEDNIKWVESNRDYFKIPDDYWEKLKKLRGNPSGVVEFSIDSVEGLESPISSSEEIKLPFDFCYDIRNKSSSIFMNPEKGVCFSE